MNPKTKGKTKLQVVHLTLTPKNVSLRLDRCHDLGKFTDHYTLTRERAEHMLGWDMWKLIGEYFSDSD